MKKPKKFKRVVEKEEDIPKYHFLVALYFYILSFIMSIIATIRYLEPFWFIGWAVVTIIFLILINKLTTKRKVRYIEVKDE